MEKFTHFRDAATGIQPFLTPSPPQSTSLALQLAIPVRFLVGIVRCLLLLVISALYIALALILANLFRPISPLYNFIRYAITAILARMALLVLGISWVDTQIVNRNRARLNPKDSWKEPSAGDIIVSNSISWIELLWLSWRFDATFVRAVVQPPTSSLRKSPSAKSVAEEETKIIGFVAISLLSMIASTGYGPIVIGSKAVTAQSIDAIRKSSSGPVVVFPELTTSNGRALLQFAPVFAGQTVPVKAFKVFVMCVRCDPPTELRISLSHTVPSKFGNPLLHIWGLATSLAVSHPFVVRFLSLSECPSSQTMKVSDFIKSPVEDELSEICASLISQVGKIKRIQQSWQSKLLFLDFYNAKRVK